MKTILKRSCALLLCVAMLLGILPVSYAAEHASTGLMLQSAQSSPSEYFEEQKSKFIGISIKAISADASDRINSEYVGQPFRYEVEILFQPNEDWFYPSGSRTSLFTQYENNVLTLTAPEGIRFIVDGQAVNEKSFTIDSITAPTSGSTTTRTFTIDAVMTGNGSVENDHQYSKLGISFDTKVMVTGETERTKTDKTEHHITFSYPESAGAFTPQTNNSDMKAVADGVWSVRKAAETDATRQARRVTIDGVDYVFFTYYIDAGRRGSSGAPDSDSGNYTRYGMIDIDPAASSITDSIDPVTDKSGVTVYPDQITVTYADGTALPEGSLSVSEGNTGFSVSANSFKKVANKSTYGTGDVKAYTKYKVELRYPADNFTYALTDKTKDPFTFKDTATLDYTPKAGTKPDPTSDDAQIEWRDIAGGGNVSVSEKLFDSATDATGKEFNDFYQGQFKVDKTQQKTVAYRLYRAIKNGETYTVLDGNDDWTATLYLNEGNNGTVYTENNEELKNNIPEGWIAIAPDYSNMDPDWLLPVSETNGAAPSYYYVNVVAGQTSQAAFGLQLQNAGFVSATKTLSDGGAALETGAALADTVFHFTNTADPSKSKDMTISEINGIGSGLISLRPGTYTVTETAPAGYAGVTFRETVTVAAGGRYALNNGNAVVNYPANATLNVAGKMTDQWILNDAAATDVGASALTDGDVNYKIQYLNGSTWADTAYTADLSATGGTVTLPRYDTAGNLITYRVAAVSDHGLERCGAVLDGATFNGTEAAYSAGFNFPDEAVSYTHSVTWYYLRHGAITVQKEVVDNRSATNSSVQGWTMNLHWEDENGDHALSTDTDADGRVSFENLRKKNANNEYITYTVSESLPQEQQSLWSVSYPEGGNETGHAVTFSATTDQQTVKVRNTYLVGALTLAKKDADTEAALPGAEYKIYALEGETRKYVGEKAQGDTYGFRTFTSKENASTFTTGADGTFTVKDLPVGYTYYAEEIKAPTVSGQGYLLDAEPVAFGLIDAAVLSRNVTHNNTKFPTLKIRKLSVNPKGDAKSVSRATAVEFELYTKNGDTMNKVAKDAYDQDVLFTAEIAAGKNSADTNTVSLAAYGEYYLKEISVGPELFTPGEQEAGTDQPYTVVGGVKYFGPYSVSEKADGKQQVAVYNAFDAVNTGTLNVAKYSYQDTEHELAAKDGFTYVIMAAVDPDDADTLALLGETWHTSLPDGVTQEEIAPYSPVENKQWYFSGSLSASSASVSGLPVKNSAGEDIVYRVLELTPPTGYYNKVNFNGTQGHTVSDPVNLSLNSAKTVFAGNASLYDLPVIEVIGEKKLENVWDVVTGDRNPALQGGVTLALYHVTMDEDGQDGTLDAYVHAGVTGNETGRFTFNTKALDYRERYVLVETDSNGQDTWLNGSTSGGRISIDSDSLTGKKLSDLISSAEYGSYNFKLLDLSGLTPANKTAYSTLTNYVPYFQISLNKEGYKVVKVEDPSAPENPDAQYWTDGDGVKWERTFQTEHLDRAKFYLYTIPSSAYAQYNDPAGAIAAKAATTDGYVYETGMNSNGQFITVNLPYYEDTVYILKEFQAPDGYGIPAPQFRDQTDYYNGYIVITPAQYQTETYKNGILPVSAENDTYPGDGGTPIRYFRVELDKYVNVKSDGIFDPDDPEHPDWPLADVTFTMQLVNKNGDPVFTGENAKSDPFRTFFTTGTDKTKPGHAQSETFMITKSILEGLETKISGGMDSVFTFYSKDGTTKLYEDYKNAVNNVTVENPAALLVDDFEIGFRLLLTESEFPETVTPFKTEYLVSIRTTKENGKTFVNSEYTYVPNTSHRNPILNVEGKYVLVQAEKLINGKRWAPAPGVADDYVEFKYILKYSSDPDAIQSYTVRIDNDNYTIPPTAYLSPDSDYIITETHAPAGYDKQPANYISFHTRALSSRTDPIPANRVQKVAMTDTPYITFTVVKKDSAGNPVSGKKLKLVYSAKANNKSADIILDANRVALTEGFSGVTDGEGKVTFTVPMYDYRQAKQDGTYKDIWNCSATATYRVIELDGNDARVTAFDVINGSHTTVQASELPQSNIVVINQEPTDLTLRKIGISDVEAPLAGRSFELRYAPFESNADYTAWRAANKLPADGKFKSVGDTWTTSDEGTISFTGLSSGFYKLKELEVPEEYMFEGGAAEITFALITPADAASLQLEGVAFTPAGGWPVHVYGIAITEATDTADNNGYITAVPAYDASTKAITLTVTNTHKGALDITKLFKANDVVAIPGTVSYYIKKGTSVVVPKFTVSIDANGAGSAYASRNNDYIWLEPGEYSVVEATEAAQSWYATAAVTGSSASANDQSEHLIEPDTAKSEHTVANVVVTAANTAAKHVTVSFTNRNAKMGLVAQKIDDKGLSIGGAGFIVFRKDGEKEYYYKQDAANGMGVWTETLSEAKTFETVKEGDDKGKLTVEFTAAWSDVSAATAPDFVPEGTYGIREIYADERIRELAPDKEFTFRAGQIITKESDGDSGEKDIVLTDGTGLYIDFVLHGRTRAHAKDSKPTPLVNGAKFSLYKVSNGAAQLVTSYTESGDPVTVVTTAGTDEEAGRGGFSFLDMLSEGESYVLVETAVAEGYYNTSTYSEGYHGDTPLSAEAVLSSGYVVFTYEELQQEGAAHYKQVDIYNMPLATLLILKYDYDYPQVQIPVNAIFKLELTGSDYYAFTEEEQGNGGKVIDTTAQVLVSEAASKQTQGLASGYTYASSENWPHYFSQGDKNYSFVERRNTVLIPGTYTITETERATGYFYTSSTTYPECSTVRTNITVDDDGGITVVEFANIPNPEENNLHIKKEVASTHGTAEGGDLGNLQEVFDDGTRQTVTFTISEFAPGKGPDGKVPDAVKYPMKQLYLIDSGLTFKDHANADISRYVDQRIESITVGKANYTENAVAAMNAAVYGSRVKSPAEADWTLLATLNVAEGAASVPADKFEAADYVAFKVVYNEGSDIRANFKAEPVSVTYSMLQQDNIEIELAAHIKNNVTVTMGYDFGSGTEMATFTIGAEASTDPEHVLNLPPAKVTKTAQVLDVNNNVWVDQTEIGPESLVRYTLVFKNLAAADSGLSIPDPFVMDILPDCIDIGAATEESEALTAATTGTLSLGDVVVDGRNVYVQGTGSLMPGETITLVIEGSVNTAKVLEAKEQHKEIRNQAYAGSATVIGKNKMNKYGAPFFTDGGSAPETCLPDGSQYSGYAVVMDNVNHTINTAGEISIYKMVAGEVTDTDANSHNYMSGYEYENVAITNSEGLAFYKIIVSSNGAIGREHLRIADILPFSGDRSITDSYRSSKLTLKDPDSFKVTFNGADFTNYTYIWSDSTSPSYYQGLLFNGFTQGGSPEGARGFCIQINAPVAQGDQIVITFTCRAPKSIEDGPVYNYYKWAVNNATAFNTEKVSDPAATADQKRAYLCNSNPCCVTILPEQKAEIGDTVWLDMNANGIQDEGEPVFSTENGYPGVKNISLRTFKSSDVTYTVGKAKSLLSGKYGFSGLSTALPMPEYDAHTAYDALHDATADYLNGNIKNIYQLVIDATDIPEGYLVTKPYAGNGGIPTTFGVKQSDELQKVLIWDGDTGKKTDRSFEDSDFVLREDGKYLTRRFFLPLQAAANGKYASVADYPNFDLGLVRVRNLSLTKMGGDGKPVAGAKFNIYGSYEEVPEPADVPKPGDDGKWPEPLATLETGADGTCNFTSSQACYLNYYSYYIIVETSAPEPYAAEISSVTGNTILPVENGNYFLLKPATDDSQALITENVTATDVYHTQGTWTLEASKHLNGAEIPAGSFFDGAFTFTFDSEDDTQNFGAGEAHQARILTNSGSAVTGDMSLSFDFPETLPEEGIEYHYTVVENAYVSPYGEKHNAVVKDPATVYITLKITDPEGDGHIVITPTVTKGETPVTDGIAFENELKLGSMKINKTVTGTPATDSETFPIDIVFTPESGLAPLFAEGVQFEYTSNKVDGKQYLTMQKNCKATLVLTDDETVTILGLPVNTGFAVTEQNVLNRGYTVSYEGNEGTITESTVPEVKVTNDRQVGTLKLTKQEEGTGKGKVTDFAFTVTLEYPTGVDITMPGNMPVLPAPLPEGVTASLSSDAENRKVTVTATLQAGKTLELTNILKGTSYAVTEQDYKGSGYTTDYNAGSGSLTEDAMAPETTVTNTRNTGDLTVAKALAGNAYEKDEAGKGTRDFSFTVMLKEREDGLPVAGTYATKDGSGTAGTITFTKVEGKDYASASFTLKGGESLTIEDIVAETQYTVVETDPRGLGYVPDAPAAGRTGEIVSGNRELTETITNTRNAGELAITKKTEGTGKDKVTVFRFTTVLTYEPAINLNLIDDDNANINLPVLSEEDGVSLISRYVSGNTVTIVAEIDLTNENKNDTIHIGNIVNLNENGKGTTYTVTETDYSSYGYLVTLISDETEPGLVATGNVQGAADITRTYTNVRNSGTLTVTKALAGNASEKDEAGKGTRLFRFTAMLRRADKIPVTGEYKTEDENGTSGTIVFRAATGTEYDAIAEFTLKGGESLTVFDILDGTEYVVVETDPREFGYVRDTVNHEGTIAYDKASEETITNTRNAGKLAITKKAEGTGKDKVTVFRFTTVLSYEPAIDLNAIDDDNVKINLPVLSEEDGVSLIDYTASDDNTVTIVAEIDLEKSENGTIVIGNIVNLNEKEGEGTAYAVTEENYFNNGYLVTRIDDKQSSDLKISGTVIADAEEAHTYTNVRNSGSLKVMKKIEGNAAETDREFTFTVTLAPRKDKVPYDESYAFIRTSAKGIATPGKLAFTIGKDGSAVSEEFTLTGGESLELADILTDSVYLVHEKDYKAYGYVTSGNDASGRITEAVTDVTVTNRRSIGALSLTKKLAGNATNKLKEYEFTVTLTNPDKLPVAGDYLCTRTAKNGAASQDTVTFKGNTDGSAVATFTLAGGETILIPGVPENTKYTVEEEDYRAAGYATKMTNETGAVKEAETSKVECTNTRNAGSLKIMKTVVAEGMGIPEARKFTFTVSLSLPNGAPFTGTLKGTDQKGGAHNVTFVGGTATVQLAHDESMTIEDILVDSEYSVKETEEKDVVSTVSSGTSGVMTTAGATASFTNELRQEYTSLSFRKEFSKDKENEKRPESVTIQLSNRDGVVGTYELNEANGWAMTVEDLPKYDAKGSEYTYTLIELPVPKNYKPVYTAKDHTIVITNVYRKNRFEVIEDLEIPLGAGMTMNEGYCFE